MLLRNHQPPKWRAKETKTPRKEGQGKCLGDGLYHKHPEKLKLERGFSFSVDFRPTVVGSAKTGFFGKQGLSVRETRHFRRFQVSEEQNPSFCGPSVLFAVFVETPCFRWVLSVAVQRDSRDCSCDTPCSATRFHDIRMANLRCDPPPPQKGATGSFLRHFKGCSAILVRHCENIRRKIRHQCSVTAVARHKWCSV